MTTVTVALPVRNGMPSLEQVLDAVERQRVDRELELLVADNGSTDGTVDCVLRHGGTVIDVPPEEFTHGGTRDLLMQHATGDHVAFLTDDSVPASGTWLASMLEGFELAPDVALAYGPYVPRPDASVPVARELTEFFASLSRDGSPRIDRGLRPEDRRPGPVTFFTDANSCVARWAWERVPFRPVASAEDHVLAIDMLAAGYAKAFVPAAAVVHSHDDPPRVRLGRFFDEFRALREIYGHVEEVGVRHTLGTIRRNVARDRAFAAAHGRADPTLESLAYHVMRAAGAALGTRADRLPAPVCVALSRERRGDFAPVAERPAARV